MYIIDNKINMELLKTTAEDADFRVLVRELDAYLTVTDGEEHTFYDQYNQLDSIKYVILGYQAGKAVACGAIKAFDADTVEVKRMYVLPTERGAGLASQILRALEVWAKELGYQKCILETGNRQMEAIRLYEKNGYAYIPNYGQYAGIANSKCFGKTI